MPSALAVAGKRKYATGRDELSRHAGENFYFVLQYKGQALSLQLEELGLKDGDKVILWEEDCDGFEMEATLLLDYKHPMMFERALWAKAVVQNS